MALQQPSFKLCLFLHHLGGKADPFLAFLRKIAQPVVDLGSGTIGGSRGLLYVLAKFLEVFDHEQLRAPDLKGQRQPSVFPGQSRAQGQALFAGHHIRADPVRPVRLKGKKNPPSHPVRGIPRMISLQILFHQTEKPRRKAAVLPPVIPAVIASAAVRAVTFHIQHTLIVKNHVEGENFIFPDSSSFRFSQHPLVEGAVSKMDIIQDHFPVPAMIQSLFLRRRGQLQTLPERFNIKIGIGILGVFHPLSVLSRVGGKNARVQHDQLGFLIFFRCFFRFFCRRFFLGLGPFSRRLSVAFFLTSPGFFDSPVFFVLLPGCRRRVRSFRS